METKEIWKPIKGYEGLYEVSNLGNVRSLGNNKNRKTKILSPGETKGGYLLVNLCKNRNVKSYKIHRLVAEAFLPNWFEDSVINHIDENPSNNNVDNLEWCSQNYNCNYGNRNKKISEKMSKPVIQLTKFGKIIKEWSSTREAEKDGFNHSCISLCCSGKQKSHKGYIWKYK